MKKLLLISFFAMFGFMVLFNCSCSNHNEKILNHTKKEFEIYSITFHKFDASTGEMTTSAKYLVNRRDIGDSILCFDYYLNNVQTPGFRFNTKDGRFDFIQEKKDFNLGLIDTINVVMFDKKIELYKFMLLNPAIDGGIVFLFDKKHGLLATKNSWNTITAITKINSLEIAKEVKIKLFSEKLFKLNGKPC